MSDIVAFLTARLDEDEALASVARDEHAGMYATVDDAEWRAHPAHGGIYTESRGNLVVQGRGFDFDLGDGTAGHIARHDPARVLADVAAKRRILERHHAAAEPHWRNRPSDPLIYDCVGCGYEGDLEQPRDYIHECPELRDLAVVYAGHPDFNESWRS